MDRFLYYKHCWDGGQDRGQDIDREQERGAITHSKSDTGGAQQVAFINLFDDDGDSDADHDHDVDADADRDHNYDDSAITHCQSDEIGAQQVIHLVKAKPNKKDASKEG